MFQKTDLTAVPRICVPFLLAILAVALSGCAGMQRGADSDLDRAVTGGYSGNETLAVLLPESGRFAGAAQIVRDGLVAARDADPQAKRPALRFYDSATGSIAALVRRAAADGATMAIGPLQKPAVDKLASASALPIPVLALNEAAAAGSPPSNLYQFTLSPEGEAAQVAAKAQGKGYSTALMLYPEGNWGNRISRAFRQEWKARGGALAAAQVYDPARSDFSEAVAGVSERGLDADFVFLVATSKLARRIWPQLRHKIGAEMPVYSTSHVYSGRFDPQADKGLAGLNFVEIPWLVEPAPGDAVSSKGLHGRLPRLYAMGVDAYRLGSRLEWMSQSPRALVQGKTGILSMESRGRIHRELTLARFDADGPSKTAATSWLKPGSFARPEPLYAVGPRIAAVGAPGLATIDQ